MSGQCTIWLKVLNIFKKRYQNVGFFKEFLAHCVLLLWSTTFILSSNDISTWFLWQLIWERECRRKTVVVFYPVTLWTLLWLYQYPVKREKYGKKVISSTGNSIENQVTISNSEFILLSEKIFLKNLNKSISFSVTTS